MLFLVLFLHKTASGKEKELKLESPCSGCKLISKWEVKKLVPICEDWGSSLACPIGYMFMLKFLLKILENPIRRIKILLFYTLFFNLSTRTLVANFRFDMCVVCVRTVMICIYWSSFVSCFSVALVYLQFFAINTYYVYANILLLTCKSLFSLWCNQGMIQQQILWWTKLTTK